MATSRLGRLSSFAPIIGIALLMLCIALTPAWAGVAKQIGRIAFIGNQSGSWQLYTMNPDGTEMVQLTNLEPTSWETWAPHISEDGRHIVFSYGISDSGGNVAPDLFVINVDGTGLTQVTNDGRSLFPIWTPDGGTITFCRVSTRTGRCVVTTMQADGKGNKTAITSDLWDNLPTSYTPDGRQIVFFSQQGGLISAVWIMNANGAGQRRLTDPELKASASDISPDGQHIAFINNQNSPTTLPNAIFVMRIDGTDVRQLTHPGKHHDLGGSYSPDGAQLVFASDRNTLDTSLDIYTMNADGTGITRAASGLTIGGCPDDNCVNANWGPKP